MQEIVINKTTTSDEIATQIREIIAEKGTPITIHLNVADGVEWSVSNGSIEWEQGVHRLRGWDGARRFDAGSIIYSGSYKKLYSYRTQQTYDGIKITYKGYTKAEKSSTRWSKKGGRIITHAQLEICSPTTIADPNSEITHRVMVSIYVWECGRLKYETRRKVVMKDHKFYFMDGEPVGASNEIEVIEGLGE